MQLLIAKIPNSIKHQALWSFTDKNAPKGKQINYFYYPKITKGQNNQIFLSTYPWYPSFLFWMTLSAHPQVKTKLSLRAVESKSKISFLPKTSLEKNVKWFLFWEWRLTNHPERSSFVPVCLWGLGGASSGQGGWDKGSHGRVLLSNLQSWELRIVMSCTLHCVHINFYSYSI